MRDGTEQHLAVVEALRLGPEDLRRLATLLEARREIATVRDLAEAMLAILPSDHTWRRSLRRLAAWAGETDCETVTPSEIVEWSRHARAEALHDHRARHGVSAQESFIVAARAAYTNAVAIGLTTRNPAAEVALPERPISRRRALTAEQLSMLHRSLTMYSRDPDLDGLVFQLLRETACRRAGAIGIAPADLAPASRTLTLVEKYSKSRLVPVSAHLAERLTGHHRRRHAGCDVALLHRHDGGHLNRKWFEGFARRCQTHLPWAREMGVSAHWWRHTTLTDIERVAGTQVAATYAGHTARSVTAVYTKASLEELAAAHARVFFDRPDLAADPAVAPQLHRRVAPANLDATQFVEPGTPRPGAPGE